MNLRHKAITQRIDFNELAQKYSQRVRVEVPKEVDEKNYESLPLAAWVFVLGQESFQEMVDEIVQFTFEETFKMIKRNLES